LICLVLILPGIAGILFYQRKESYFADPSYYIVLGQSLAEKGTYEFNFKAHTLYPPGLPALLAVFSTVSGRSGYSAFVRLMPALLALSLIVYYFLLRTVTTRQVAAVACLLLAFSPYSFQLVTQRVCSEPLYLLVSGLALLWATKAVPGFRRTDRGRSIWVLAAGVTIAAMVLVRTVGIAVLGGIVLSALRSVARGRPTRRLVRSYLPLFLAVSVTAGFWFTWTNTRKNPDWDGQMSNYADQFFLIDPHEPSRGSAAISDIVGRVSKNAIAQSAHVTELVTRLSFVDPLWFSPGVLIPLVLVLTGLARHLRQGDADIVCGYFLSYVAIYMIWPFDQGPRFMMPVFPLIISFAWDGAEKMMHAVRRLGVATTCRTVFLISLPLFIFSAPGLGRYGKQGRASVVFWLLLAGAAVLGWAFQCHLPGLFARLATIRPLLRWGFTGFLAVLLVIGAAGQVGIALENLRPDATKFLHYSSVEAAHWLRWLPERTGSVMGDQVAIIHRISGWRVVEFPKTRRTRFIHDVIVRNDVRFVVIPDPKRYPYYRPPVRERWTLFMQAYPGMFRRVHRGPGYEIFQRTPSE